MQYEILQKERTFRRKFGIQSITIMVTILIINGLSFISTKILTNFLTKPDYGNYSFWISFVFFISGFSTAVFSASIWRYLTESTKSPDPGRKSRLFTLSFFGSFLFLIILFFLLFFAYFLFKFMLINAKNYILILTVIFFISFFYSIKELVLVLSGAEQNSKEIFSFNLSFGIMSFIGSCIAAVLYSNYIAVLFGLIIGISIPSFIFFLVKISQYSLSTPSTRDIKKVFRYGGPRMIQRSMSLFVPFLSIFMVNIWLGESGVATMAIGYSISGILSIILDNFLMTYRPYITNSYEEGAFDKANKTTTRIIELFLVFSLPLIFWLINLSPVLIEIISNQEYLDAIVLVPFTVISSFLISLSFFWLVRIDLKEKTYLSAIIHFLAFLVLSASCYIFIPSLNLFGAGISLLIHSLVILILTFFIGNSMLKVNLNYLFIMKLIISLLAALFAFVVFDIIGFSIIISSTAFSILYILSLLWIRALSKEEIKKILNLIINFKNEL